MLAARTIAITETQSLAPAAAQHLPWPRLAELDEAGHADLYVREAWPDWQTSEMARRTDDLGEVGLVLVKPDGVVSGKVGMTLGYLEDHGFELLVARRAHLDRHTVRAIWSADWLAYSADRLAFCDLLYTAAPALALLVRDPMSTAGPRDLSRLAALKGSAFPERRQQHHLRSVLNSKERVLNFVHTSDCFVATVRESGILFPAQDRQAALIPMRRHEIVTAAAETEAATVRHELDCDAAMARLPLPLALRCAMRSGVPIPFCELRALAIDWSDPIAVWDLITLASRAIALDAPGWAA